MGNKSEPTDRFEAVFLVNWTVTEWTIIATGFVFLLFRRATKMTLSLTTYI